MEGYLQEHFALFQKHQISDALISSDVIECLFGKIKYLIEKSPIKDFNKLVLLLPALVGELTEESVSSAQKIIKIKNIKEWDARNIGDTILKQKKKFGKLEIPSVVPEHANKLLEKAA